MPSRARSSRFRSIRRRSRQFFHSPRARGGMGPKRDRIRAVRAAHGANGLRLANGAGDFTVTFGRPGRILRSARQTLFWNSVLPDQSSGGSGFATRPARTAFNAAVVARCQRRIGAGMPVGLTAREDARPTRESLVRPVLFPNNAQ